MRKKQCATRRIGGSGDEDEEAAALAGMIRSELLGGVCAQASRSTSSTNSAASSVNGQLEDGTLVVQPEPAATDNEDFEVSRSVNGSRSSFTAAPGIYDTIKCTACGKKVNPYNGTMQVHPLLKVLVCHKCFKYYASGHFEMDQDGKENQCRWCGEGGSLICCDQCEHSFCRTCIKRNLGRSALQQVEALPDDEVWNCYACDQTVLKDLQEEASVVMKAVRDHYKQSNRRSEKWKASAAKKAHTSGSNTPSHVSSHMSSQAANQASSYAASQISNQTASQVFSQAVGLLGLQLDLNSMPKPPSGQAQPTSTSNGSRNSVQTELWYKKNVKIDNILSEIESVNVHSIDVALNATISLLQGMMRQYSRFVQDLSSSRDLTEKEQVVSRFKSAYRMHLFLRLGKLRTMIAEEEQHMLRKSGATQPIPPHQAKSRQQPTTKKHPARHNQSQGSAKTAAVIDLTEDTSRSEVPEQGLQLPVVDNKEPAEVVVVLSDEEDEAAEEVPAATADSGKKEKPAAILELLEQRRQREKSRKLQQPRKIVLPSTNRRLSSPSSNADQADTPLSSGGSEETVTKDSDAAGCSSPALSAVKRPHDPGEFADSNESCEKRLRDCSTEEESPQDEEQVGDNQDSRPPEEPGLQMASAV